MTAKKLITFLDGIKSDNNKKLHINELNLPKEVYESSMYDDSSLYELENTDQAVTDSRVPFKRNSNFTPPPTEIDSSRSSSKSPLTSQVLSHAKGTAILPPIPSENTLQYMLGVKNGKNNKLSARDKRELLYGPGGMFGPKGPFSTPIVRYPGGLQVNMSAPPPPSTPHVNFASSSRFLQRGGNLARKSPSGKVFNSELSSVAEDRSDGRSQIVSNSVFAFASNNDCSRPHSRFGEEDDNENIDKNSVAASTTLILENASSSASKPPSRMEPYRFCELIGEAARVNVDMGNFEESSEQMGNHWREEETQRMMAWISNSQLNDLWLSSQYNWLKVRYLQV